uniref:Uncharacterized protein n=1 Tax=Siphoviridae sp. ct7OC5 TaxID=2825350 RepID=A0A8S5TST9_9CAUD|nr:MAG TPA: Protein of unknown function (DUF2639) [Siphoviridae sp. ct7OC5]
MYKKEVKKKGIRRHLVYINHKYKPSSVRAFFISHFYEKNTV